MDKLYSISKTAEILDVTPKTLRIWDKENKLKPILTSGGHRRYRESDINKIMNNAVANQDSLSDLLNFKKDARITILKNEYYINGLDEPPVPSYQVVLGWDYEKNKTEEGTSYNSFIESFGLTIDECVERLKKDIDKIKKC
jgi:hypothetical protein